MNAATRDPLPVPSLRQVLIASWSAARRCVNANGEIVLNEASHAGMLLAMTGDPRAACTLETGADEHGLAVRAHLRACALEELADARSGERAREERRRMPTISDETPDSEGEVE